MKFQRKYSTGLSTSRSPLEPPPPLPSLPCNCLSWVGASSNCPDHNNINSSNSSVSCLS